MSMIELRKTNRIIYPFTYGQLKVQAIGNWQNEAGFI